MWHAYPGIDVPKDILEFCKTKKVHQAFAPILLRKGINTPEQMDEFLFKSLADTAPSTAFGEDMHKGVKRLRQAINKGEHIVVFGDYDVDGTTGTSVVLSVLKNVSNERKFTYDFMIPDRFNEGYGLNDKNIGRLLSKKPNLVITVDCGITSSKQVTELKKLGIDVIITDHHQPKGELPLDAVAIIHPIVNNYPLKGLCGCAVAYQFMKGIWETRGLTPPDWILYDQLDLVALGTVCDMMPLQGDNRVYVREGLIKMNKKPRLPIQIMKEYFKWNSIDTTTLGFYLGPMINAAGRIKDADTAVKFFASTLTQECKTLVEELANRNAERKSIQKDIIEEAVQQAEKQEYKNIIVVKGDFHGGIVGIAAGNIVNRFYKPTFILHGHGEKIGGSARSITGIDLFKEMQKHEHLLHSWGGHAAAAGIQMFKDNEKEFFAALDNELAKYPPETWQRTAYFDAEITSGDQLGPKFNDTLMLLEPFGQTFPKLNFKVTGMIVDGRELDTDKKIGKIQIGDVKYGFAMWDNGDRAFLERQQTFYGRFEWNDKYKEIQFVAVDAEPPTRPKIKIGG